ncbi:hypothetical protein Droror1_Dr00001948 [Drosera rotundifolia]
MLTHCTLRFKMSNIMGCLQFFTGGFVIILSLITILKLSSHGFFFRHEEICRYMYGIDETSAAFDVKALTERVHEVLDKMESLQNKLELAVEDMEKAEDDLSKSTVSKPEFTKYLKKDVMEPLYQAHMALREIQLPRFEAVENTSLMEDPLINYFVNEEIHKYITPKKNRNGKINMFGKEDVYNTIGHACVLVKKELEEYMDYDISSYCNDDWNLAQDLMLRGCDPLPRRRCLTRASKLYLRPDPINVSLWKLPESRNVRWSNYKCKNFECLSSKNPGYSRCNGCFDMGKEKLKWVNKTSSSAEFSFAEVLDIKPGEIRIGLDYSVGTGTFAARMREHNVTIITTALNLRAPFSELIALRGLLPLYITPNQRLPFFDNTMDLIHTNMFLDGWIDLLLLDFMLFDWDRVLRPGGLLWIDKFYCDRSVLDDYMYLFLQFRYKKHKWVVSPKSKDEVYLSALLEKTPRSL